MTYYNTTNMKGNLLKNYGLKAMTQDQIILDHMKFLGTPQAPSQVWEDCFNTKRTPLTSVRRSITNLYNNGYLKYTDKKIKGPYGRPEGLWVIA